ncbi:MAG: hypothetical protein QOE60_1760 [Thermoleophilaceae bacterium]|nr:hypothetical protein [Thermoleophilaceae bacterium]
MRSRTAATKRSRSATGGTTTWASASSDAATRCAGLTSAVTTRTSAPQCARSDRATPYPVAVPAAPIHTVCMRRSQPTSGAGGSVSLQ